MCIDVDQMQWAQTWLLLKVLFCGAHCSPLGLLPREAPPDEQSHTDAIDCGLQVGREGGKEERKRERKKERKKERERERTSDAISLCCRTPPQS